MKSAQEEPRVIEEQLTEWEWNVAQIILEIPPGRLVTYGCLAKVAAQRHGNCSTKAYRAIGNLRMKLYGLLTHDTKVPLHRIATQGDLYSENDSNKTRRENKKRRTEERTPYDNTAWWCPLRIA